jgi:hypothetical protein
MNILSCKVTRAYLLVALAITAVIAYGQIALRAQVFDPDHMLIFDRLFLFEDYPAALLAIVLLIAATIPAIRTAALGVVEICGAHPRMIAALVTAVLIAGSLLIYHRYPLSMDEYAAVFQSKIFAAGQLAGRFPPELIDWLIPHRFQGQFLMVSHDTGRVAGAYWPSFALLLTPFTALGASWLLNPLLGGATVILIHRIAMELFADARLAGMAVLLTIASPAVSVNAISFYSMPAHLVLNCAFL